MHPTTSAAELNAFLRELAPLRHRSSRHIFAILLAGLALAVAALFDFAFGAGPAAVFAFFVILSTGIFGMFAGLWTVAIGALAVDYYYLPPIFHLNLDAGTLRVALGLTVTAGLTHVAERRITKAIRKRVKPPLGMEGSFDAVEDGEAYGWALNADFPNEPVLVTAFVNGKPVAQVAAVHYRPDIAQKKNAGSHGFYIDLRPHVQSHAELVVDMRFSNGALLPNAPKFVCVPRLESQKPLSTMLFMHIPKTAGTALREALAANMRQSEIAYLYPSPPGFLVRDLRDLPLEQLRYLRMVIGHFQFGMHEWLPQSFEYITIVREPAARVLSQYRYLYETQAGSRVVGLQELFAKHLTVDFDNAMVRCFAGVDEHSYGPGQLTEEHYARAVLNMRTGFTYVGHQEWLSESYEWLARHYGWKTISELSATNVTKVGPDNKLSADLIATIRHYNRWDCLFYEEVCRVFPPPSLNADHESS